jgi:hypothetical protein
MNRSPRDPFVKEDEMSQGSDVNEVSEQRLEEIESLFVQTAHCAGEQRWQHHHA